MFDFKIKLTNLDFQVIEVPLLPEVKSPQKSKYTYIWLRKSNYTTFQALEVLAEFFKVSLSDINAQGLKDEDAITSQIISIKKILTQNLVGKFNKHYFKNSKSFISIERITGYGLERVKERYLHGNCFKIKIRNLRKNNAEKLVALISQSRTLSFINYYDSQRFGMPGGPYNTHLIGKAIIDSNLKRLKNELSISKNNINLQSINCWDDFFDLVDERRISFFINSYNSLLFNKSLSEQIKGLNPAEKIEFLNMPKLYIPKKPNYICPNQIEVEGFSIFEKKAIPKIKTRLASVQTAVYVEKYEKDRMHQGRFSITISFFLPTGSYGTMLINQLIYWADKV